MACAPVCDGLEDAVGDVVLGVEVVPADVLESRYVSVTQHDMSDGAGGKYTRG